MRQLRWRSLDQRQPDDLLQVQRAFYPPGYAFTHHCHDFHEFMLVLAGSGFHDLIEHQTALRPGDLLAIRPELTHRCRAGREALIFFNVVVSPASWQRHRHFLEAVPGWAEPGPPPVIRLGESATAGLLDHLIELEQPGMMGDTLAVSALLTDLAWRHRRRQQVELIVNPLIRQLLDALDDPSLLVEGVSALARHLSCSREHLTRLSRRHLGKPLAQLLAERRLERAARLLRHDDASITEVCFASGHGSLSHFHHVFRHHFGCTPQDYRRRNHCAPA